MQRGRCTKKQNNNFAFYFSVDFFSSPLFFIFRNVVFFSFFSFSSFVHLPGVLYVILVFFKQNRKEIWWYGYQRFARKTIAGDGETFIRTADEILPLYCSLCNSSCENETTKRNFFCLFWVINTNTSSALSLPFQLFYCVLMNRNRFTTWV